MQKTMAILVCIGILLTWQMLIVTPASADLTAELCGKLVKGGNDSFAVDTVEGRETPVRHCYIHGTLAQDSTYYIALPENWNGKFVRVLGGGWGGSESNSDIFLSLGYATASSNQGHIGSVFDQSDTFQELDTIRNHQLTKFARSKIQKLYGTKPTYTYLTGTSAGAWRSLSQLEAYPGEYDGAAISTPAIEPRLLSVWMCSLPDYYYPVFWSKLDQIIAARDRGDPEPFSFLTPEEVQALNQIYDGGANRGSEFAWPTTNSVTIRLGYIAFVLFDPTYLDDFWTQPGYAGYEGEVDSEIVEGITGTVTAVGAPNSVGEISSFSDSSKAFSENQVKGYTVVFTSGELSGKSFWVASHTADTMTTISYAAVLNGISVGDTYTMHNHEFLAWKHYHRHIVLCDRPEYKNFCENGEPIYVQRPPQVQNAYDRSMLTGKIHAPAVVHISGFDDLIWSPTDYNWVQRVYSVFGSQTDEILRVYWGENQLHYDTPRAPSADQINHAVEKTSMYHKGFVLMTQWVENGIAPPPSTVINFTPGNLTFPATADQRKGIQPTVNPTANDSFPSVAVPVNSTVEFNGEAESPIANIIKYEWDFDSDNNYDCEVTSTSSTCAGAGTLTPSSTVNLLAEFMYTTTGTYVATVRVTDDTDNPEGMVDGIENLARVVVEVLPTTP